MIQELAKAKSWFPGEWKSQAQIFLLIRDENIIKYPKNWKHM